MPVPFRYRQAVIRTAQECQGSGHVNTLATLLQPRETRDHQLGDGSLPAADTQTRKSAAKPAVAGAALHLTGCGDLSESAASA